MRGQKHYELGFLHRKISAIQVESSDPRHALALPALRPHEQRHGGLLG
ncbi:hypothetical protein MPNT_200047 [Candidatus Methylacidithermus pantelleriae]|uniref:Uncharacterized protein n=1 Tax=Candidatus Methylacidithermus pantelleriae TaxID=2744239 RepID=A0A8J2BPN6_9BACT|nr:hypothetical protein MPNT_200047 [Candidatus Methylacidithermus pantelleriae]